MIAPLPAPPHDFLMAMRARMEADIARTFGLPSTALAPTSASLTIETLAAAARNLEKIIPVPAPLRVVFDANALEQTEDRLFPASRHRSARIRKKLIKRFGGEYRRVPAMWKFGAVLVAHPALRARVTAAVAAQ